MEKIKSEIQEKLTLFTVLSIDNVNDKPHPYCITDKHITGKYCSLGKDTIIALEKAGTASCGMYVSPSEDKYINEYKQGWKKCQVPFEEHTSDKVVFLQLKQNCTNDEASAELKEITSILEKNEIDGVSMVETPEKFRVTE